MNFLNAKFRSLIDAKVKAGRTQKELAAAMQLSEGSIVNYKRTQQPKSAELFRIARYFGVSMESFFDHGHVLAANDETSAAPRPSRIPPERLEHAKQQAKELVALLDELKSLS